MSENDFSFPSPQAGRAFQRSMSAHPAPAYEKDQVFFVSAAHMKDVENPVLQGMCRLLTSLLRVPAAGKLSPALLMRLSSTQPTPCRLHLCVAQAACVRHV